jgi:hypothetical protein
VSILGGVRRQRLEGDLGRPVIAPGNHDRKAPPGKFRVLGVDTFEGPFEDYLIADCDTKEKAIDLAKKHGADMNPTYVYDSAGKLLFNAGKP